jgi:hypothetical protein
LKGLLAKTNPGLLAETIRYFILLTVILFDNDINTNNNEKAIQIINSNTYLLSGPEFIPLEKEDLYPILIAAT